MLSEVRIRNTKATCFLSYVKIGPKISIYTKTSMIIYKLRCSTCL
jgi:hypothetical protein